MKTVFENIRLAVTTEGNELPMGRIMPGMLRVTDAGTASFEETTAPFTLGTCRTHEVFRRHGCSVRLNRETGLYRIAICVAPDDIQGHHSAEIEERFVKCMGYLERRLA